MALSKKGKPVEAPVVEAPSDLFAEAAEATPAPMVEEVTAQDEGQLESSPAVATGQRFSKGHMPLPLVWFIKFKETGTVLEIAKKYFTTPGKITDITKGSNQKYIVENMKWSKEEIADAVETIKENFVRGQDLTNPTKRQLATSTMEDAAYSLSILEKMATMEYPEDAVGLSVAKQGSPRAKRGGKGKSDKVEAVAEEETTAATAATAMENDEAVDDLLS